MARLPRALPPALSVFGPDGLVGTLFPTDPLSFVYAGTWLERAGASPLHPSVPLAVHANDSQFVAAFFENLLPEGEQRRIISLREQVSSVFGLLSCVGGESAGAYTLLPAGEHPQSPVYQPLSWEQVSALVHADSARDDIERAAEGLPAPRMSISGAQCARAYMLALAPILHLRWPASRSRASWNPRTSPNWRSN